MIHMIRKNIKRITHNTMYNVIIINKKKAAGLELIKKEKKKGVAEGKERI